MWVKKTDGPARDPDEVVSALLVPHTGRTTAEVEELLAAEGAEQVARLSPQVVSARATRQAFARAAVVARVELKFPKQKH